MAVAALLLALAAGSMPAVAAVQAVPGTAAAAAKFSIDLPAQPLADALRAVAQKAGVNILFDPVLTKGLAAPAISGSFTTAEALAKLLAGTGLRVESVQDGTLAIKSADKAAETIAPGASAFGAGVAVAGELQRVEVTGSRLKRIDAEGPVPVNVYSREDIERSGQSNLGRFLAGLNEVSMSVGESGFDTSLGQGTVQLRGMPLGSTLILINGRRVQATGTSSGNFFNLNLIPMAAIDRVEIVPMGSSAVYGGDALAGVVNVILKKSVDGLSLVTRLGSGSGLGDGSISLATGGNSADGNYLVVGSYSKSSPLTVADRATLKDADYRRFGGPDTRLSYCSPGTVSSASGGNLPGLSSTTAGIPTLPAGQTLKVSDFQATVGLPNLCNVYATGASTPLLYAYDTLALHAVGERRLWGAWSAFGEVTLARDRTEGGGLGLLLTNVLVPASNPFNPFGESVRITTALDSVNGTQGFARQTNLTRVVAGLRGEVAGGWDAELTASTIQDSGSSQSWAYSRNTAALTAALASNTPATAFNPFTSGRAASDGVLRGIWSDRLRESYGRKDQLAGLLRGTLAQLPAGRLEGTVGAETSRDRLVISATSGSQFNESRSASAVYGELRAPLLRAGEEGANGWEFSTLTLASRRDSYSDFGSANTYQAGLEIRPAKSLLVRASSANSFKPPTMSQTSVTEGSFDIAEEQLVDPLRGGEPITSGSLVRSTNRGLGPERGDARGIGLVWEPESTPGARLSASRWQLQIKGMIALLQPQQFLNYESLFPGFVIRAPSVNGQPGKVTSVRYAEVNFGRLETAGTDIDMAYAWRTSLGKLSAAAGVTRTGEYVVQLTPGAPVEDRLGRRFTDFWSPQWKGRLSVGFDQGAWTLGLTSRYLGAYKDAGASNRQLGNYWTHDLSGSVNLKKLWPGVASDFRAASAGFSIANVTNREPQFITSSPYFDSTQADWRGRYLSARLSLDW